MAAGQIITLRLTIDDPVPGVAYSLQDKASTPGGRSSPATGRCRSTSRCAWGQDRSSWETSSAARAVPALRLDSDRRAGRAAAVRMEPPR